MLPLPSQAEGTLEQTVASELCEASELCADTSRYNAMERRPRLWKDGGTGFDIGCNQIDGTQDSTPWGGYSGGPVFLVVISSQFTTSSKSWPEGMGIVLYGSLHDV